LQLANKQLNQHVFHLPNRKFRNNDVQQQQKIISRILVFRMRFGKQNAISLANLDHHFSVDCTGGGIFVLQKSLATKEERIRKRYEDVERGI